MSYQPRLKKEFSERIIHSLKNEYSYKNIMMVPRLKKIVISKGVGSAVADKKLIDHAVDELTLISGQKAIPTISKKDVASFKLRKGMPIGAKVTLRSERMYEFLDRLITSALPRVRDFQGIKTSAFDGRGNYNLGITEQIIFPEIDIDKVNKISGMDISFVTSANTDREAQSLLSELGLPFKKISVIKPNSLDKVKDDVKSKVNDEAEINIESELVHDGETVNNSSDNNNEPNEKSESHDTVGVQQVPTDNLNSEPEEAESDNPGIQKETENSNSDIEEINGENTNDKPKENN